MSRTTYDVQESYTGNGAVSAYTFDFKIEEKAQLLVVERNDSGVETRRELGTDTSTLISSVTFDAEEGGGTVNLLAVLASNYKLDIFLANDLPTQPNEFKNKFDFTLKNIENALDWAVGPIQRAAFLAQRSVKLKDFTDIATFDINLPVDIVGSASLVIGTNAAGDALAMGPTFTEIANAQTYAIAAAAAQAAAEVAQTASEAAQTAAEAAQAAAEAAAATAAASAPPAVSTAITDGLGAATITDGVTPYTFNPATVKWVDVEFSIYRGTTVVGRGNVELIYDGSAWNLFETGFNYPTGKLATHGLTFSMSGNSLQVAADTGAGTGVLLTRAFQA